MLLAQVVPNVVAVASKVSVIVAQSSVAVRANGMLLKVKLAEPSLSMLPLSRNCSGHVIVTVLASGP